MNFTQRNFRRRQGVSLQKLKAYDLRKNVTQTIKKDDEEEINENKLIRFNKNNKKLLNQHKSLSESRHINYQNFHQQNSDKQNKKVHKKFKHVLSNNPTAKVDQNVQKLCEQIIPKARCFFRFGVKSYQKGSHKRIFSDVLNVAPQQLKGSIFIGQLWNTNMTSKYFKLNKIKTHKSKFFQQLKDLKWQRIKKQRQKQLDSSNLITSVRQFSLKSIKSIQSSTNLDSLISLKHFPSILQDDRINQNDSYLRTWEKSQDYEETTKRFQKQLQIIRDDIKTEYQKCKEQDYWKNMKKLEKQSASMHKMWDKYLEKTLQMK